MGKEELDDSHPVVNEWEVAWAVPRTGKEVP
jgi:hypothetical protein